MSGNNIFRIMEGVRVREEEFGLLVISKSTPALALNPDMKRVLELIDGFRSLDEVSKLISAEFNGNDVASQVEDIFEKLVTLSLIEQVER